MIKMSITFSQFCSLKYAYYKTVHFFSYKFKKTQRQNKFVEYFF